MHFYLERAQQAIDLAIQGMSHAMIGDGQISADHLGQSSVGTQPGKWTGAADPGTSIAGLRQYWQVVGKMFAIRKAECYRAEIFEKNRGRVRARAGTLALRKRGAFIHPSSLSSAGCSSYRVPPELAGDG